MAFILDNIIALVVAFLGGFIFYLNAKRQHKAKILKEMIDNDNKEAQRIRDDLFANRDSRLRKYDDAGFRDGE